MGGAGEDDDARGARRGAAAGKAVSRTKGEPKRREGRLTIQAVAGDGDTAERMRSLASVPVPVNAKRKSEPRAWAGPIRPAWLARS